MRIAVIILFLIATQCNAQEWALIKSKADSLYEARVYRSAAEVYVRMANLPGIQPRAIFQSYVLAARSWVNASMPDSALATLGKIDYSTLSYNDVMHVATTQDFLPLMKERRWNAVMSQMFMAATRESRGAVDDSYEQEEIIYGRKDGMALTMLRLTPAKAARIDKAIIQIRSGGWGSNFYMTKVSDAMPFIRKGYTVFIVFHGSEPLYSVADAMGDVQRAVRFIRYHASSYQINPEKIGAMGTSAGAHLALMCGVSDSLRVRYSADPVDQMSSKVKAVVSYFPVSNFFNWDESGNPADSAFLFKNILTRVLSFRQWDAQQRKFEYLSKEDQHKAMLRDISPITHVSEDDAAILIFHGNKDELVPVGQSISLKQKLEAAHVPVSLHIRDGAGHGWTSSDEESEVVMRWFETWLR